MVGPGVYRSCALQTSVAVPESDVSISEYCNSCLDCPVKERSGEIDAASQKPVAFFLETTIIEPNVLF